MWSVEIGNGINPEVFGFYLPITALESPTLAQYSLFSYIKTEIRVDPLKLVSKSA